MPTTILTITNAILTAYCACGKYPQCPSGTLTAIGRAPIQGRTVAVSRQIPLNSEVRIELGRSEWGTLQRLSTDASTRITRNIDHARTYIAEDRFNKRFELKEPRRVDIFFGTNHAAAIKFGRQTGTVTYTINTN